MSHRLLKIAVGFILVTSPANAQQNGPIIDVHVHSMGPQLTAEGRPVPIFCVNDRTPV